MVKRKTTEQIIIEFIDIHGDLYLYDKVNYINKRTHVLIGCKSHGYFKQLSSNHLTGKGCKTCAINKLKTTIEQFIEKSLKIYGDNVYDYSLVIYINNKTKVKIGCKIHDYYFEQTPENHLLGCEGCLKCLNPNINNIIPIFNEKHNNRYIYDRALYINSRTKIEIGCKIHGYFFQLPLNYKNGQGCPKCTYKNETMAIQILEQISNYKFKKTRPKFLNGLELDGYNQELKLAIEYNGAQHYVFKKDFFHNTLDDFSEQQKKRYN